MFPAKLLLLVGTLLFVALAGCLFGPANQLAASENTRICNELNSATGSFSGTICAATLEKQFGTELSSLPAQLQEQRQEGIQKERIYSFSCNPDNLGAGVSVSAVQDCVDSGMVCGQEGSTAACRERLESESLPAEARAYNREVCGILIEKTGANEGTICASTIQRDLGNKIQPFFLSELAAGLQKERVYSFQCNPDDLEAGFHLTRVSDCGSGNACRQDGAVTNCESDVRAEAQPGSCTGLDGETGSTGPNAVPMISFSSNWNDFAYYTVNNDLGEPIASTNPTIGPNNTFLDAEQFLMALFWKLSEKNDAQDTQPFNFRVLLKQDNFKSTQLLESFAEQTSGFANTPSWFKSSDTPFYQYAEAAAIEISTPEDLVAPGLYKASVSYETSREPTEFFYSIGKTENQKPIIQLGIEKITVLLEPREAVFDPSPFYYISLDAATNPEDRDFGSRFANFNAKSASTAPLPFSNALSSSTFSNGSMETKISIVSNLETLNSNSPQVIATLASDGTTFFFYPQQALALAAAPNNSQQEKLSYYFIQNDTPLQHTNNSLLRWDFAATMNASCSAFVPQMGRADQKAASCVPNSSIQGFSVALPSDDYSVATSMVTVPTSEGFAVKTCTTDSETTRLATASDKSDSAALDLTAENGFKIETVAQLLDGIKQNNVCVTESENETHYSWNAEPLKEQQRAAAESLQSGLDWCEQCPLSESLLNEIIDYAKQNNSDLANRIENEQSCSNQN
jgi:hypothetical protein